jgi:4,4'-diaponeurosporenoate glycosyltransferase
VPPLPDGWRGKAWACHNAARAATGDVLLFLDADTWLEPGALPFLRGRLSHGALSVGPFHHVPDAYEQLSAFFNLLMVSGTVPTRLFGQMLMIDRSSYNRVGGHEAVRGHTLENFHLAGRLSEAGVPVRSMAGRGLLTFRMYPGGPGDLCRGWVKGFASGAAGTPPGLLLASIAWLVGMTLAVIGLAMTWLAVPAYALYATQTMLLLRAVGSFRWYTSVLYPVPLVFFYVVFTLSVLRRGRTVTWKGRSLHAD